MACKEFKSTRNGSKSRHGAFASLIAALVAFGEMRRARMADAPIAPPSLRRFERCAAVARAPEAPVGSGTRTLLRRSGTIHHGALERSERETVHMLLSARFLRMARATRKNHSRICCVFLKILVLEFIGAEFYIGQIFRRLCERPSLSWQTYSLLRKLIKGLTRRSISPRCHGMGFREHREKLTNAFWVELLRARNRLYCGDKKSGACRFRRCGRRFPNSPTRASTRHAVSKKYSF